MYGTNPRGEASLGAQAAADGADCLVIDAEAEYEGHYAAAQTTSTNCARGSAPSYPIALASFPYVSYHPSAPYSVFLGPGGAQYNAPQMYWKAIGISVDTVYANTYIGNRIYGRPIYPLGQTYESVSRSDLVRFREEAARYGATGWSFWDWQETTATRLARAGRAARAPDERDPERRIPRTAQGLQRRSGAVAAGAPGQRHPRAGNDRHLRPADARQPQLLPGLARPSRQRCRDAGDLAGAARAAARRSQLDRRRHASPSACSEHARRASHANAERPARRAGPL